MDSSCVLMCAYCVQEYPQDTPAWGTKALSEHTAKCDKHPMRAIIEERNALRSALAGLVGADDPAELKSMRDVLKAHANSDNNVTACLSAIDILLSGPCEIAQLD